MIHYETEGSSFYELNKNYCQQVELLLQAEDFSYSGYCNSFGYEINASSDIGSLKYQIIFEKHQTTQNGVIYPASANEYEGAKYKIKGLDDKIVFPNPANTILSISKIVDREEVYNIYGQLILNYYSINSISTTSLTDVIYYLRSGKDVLSL